MQDDAGDDDEPEQSETAEPEVVDATKLADQTDVDEKANRKRESKEDDEASQPKKPCLIKEEKAIENNDAEDSINLDLGEDELLNEEVCYYVFSVTVKLPSLSAKLSNGFVELMEID